jgi:hypothetical protein
MQRDQIIQWAQECWPSDRRMWAVDAELPRLERFAALVRSAALEEAAQVCQEKFEACRWDDYREACQDIESAIRALKE